MNDASSVVASHDLLLAPYFERIQSGENPATVRGQLAAEHSDPSLLAEFDELMRFLVQVEVGAFRPAPVPAPATPPAFPDFRLLREVGRGGMGVVYEAEQISLKRRVALKVNAGNLSVHRQLRFLREQRVLASLHQTNIVPIHTAGQVDGWQYFAMAFIDGAPLHHVVRSTLQRETSGQHGRTPPLRELAGEVVRARDESVASRASTQPDATSAPPPDRHHLSAARLTLSLDYYRSVARVVAEVADGLHHAHAAGVLHRDVKPANIMVDRAGHSWIIDFGLAGMRDADAATAARSSATMGRLDALMATGVMGTWQYMAPEQHAGRADVRSDVWGLGCTLYEMLTLRPAFDGSAAAVSERVRTGEPATVEALAPATPKDLVAICRKAMKKAPEERYASAEEFAADLRRWLGDEPTVARGAWMGRRMWLWTKRNRWRAAAVGLIVATLTLGIASILLMARAQAAATQAEVQERNHELRLLQLQRHRTGRPFNWSQEWLEVIQAHYRHAPREKRRKGNDEAVLALAGLDARMNKELLRNAGSLTFNSNGERLLLDGIQVASLEEVGGVYERGPRDRFIPSEQSGAGPVAFAADGTALQLVPTGAYTLRLWDADRQKKVHDLSFAAGLPPTPLKPDIVPTMALSPDGRRVAASTTLPGEKPSLVVWDAATGKQLSSVEERAATLAFTPDGNLLATADDRGGVTIRPAENLRNVTRVAQRRHPVSCFAFVRSPVRRHRDGRAASGWLLAAGESGGGISIWDLDNKEERLRLPGTELTVHGLAFSPDSTLLASVGRGAPRLWDTRTGEILLKHRVHNTFTDVAFAPDGKTLAVSSPRIHSPEAVVEIYDVDEERGIRTLRGLRTRASQVCLSPDGRTIAALSDNWEVGVWDFTTGRLLHIFEGPLGTYADNDTIAFSDDGRLAYASSSGAAVWDVATGKQLLAPRALPPGLGNRLGFTKDQLLLVRFETPDSKLLPDSRANPADHPRVIRVRNLFAATPDAPIAEYRDLNWHLYGLDLSPDGKYVVANGISGDKNVRKYLLLGYEVPSGKKLWSRPYDASKDNAWGPILLPNSNTFKVCFLHGTWALLDVKSGEERGSLTFRQIIPDGEWEISGTPPDSVNQEFGFRLHRKGNAEALVTLGTEGPISVEPLLTRAGTHLIWAPTDGTVRICDI